MLNVFLLLLGMVNQTELYSGPIRYDVPIGVEVKTIKYGVVGIQEHESKRDKK